MKILNLSLVIALSISIFSCSEEQNPRITEDFNYNWLFKLGDMPDARNAEFDDSDWKEIRLPHDWTILLGYTQENTASSTGYTQGGIGWYRKGVKLTQEDEGKAIRIEFDGIYCKSDVWINGQHLGFRPYGYSSFAYDLSEHLKFDGSENMLAVRVNHEAFVDSRWYTGSGIYRNVRLVKSNPTHIDHWGIRISTPEVSEEEAELLIETKLNSERTSDLKVISRIFDPQGNVVEESEATELSGLNSSQTIQIQNPELWGVDNPALYTLETSVYESGILQDLEETSFGIRFFKFDAETGFSLNGKSMKLKGVNLHHDAGALGAAVPKQAWETRVLKLKSIGVNAIRMAHNPHSPELMEVCDEQGILVMNEFFDEWHQAKGKNMNFLSDNQAGYEISRGYSEYFLEWAERDLKALIARDFNHPSVIMWSIGNEIEWTFPYYSEAYNKVNGGANRGLVPSMDTAKIKQVLSEIHGEVDSCALVANMLSNWVKEVDTTRPVTCGSVRASIGMATGYGDAVDVLGINYGAEKYDTLHAAFPNKKLLGSENWGAWSEWKAINERDFIAGIFCWTGYAYLGEAGPWPRKGLEISFFDFAGFKTPRGHFFECLWVEKPKAYMVATKSNESEYAFSQEDGWSIELDYYPRPRWGELRLWEWYRNVQEHWNFKEGEELIVQGYTNCEEAELFLNGQSKGKLLRADFEADNIIKWLVPFESGELKIVGYDDGVAATEYSMFTTGKAASIELHTERPILNADDRDIAYVELRTYDEAGREIRDLAATVDFEVSGAGKLLAVDNGWENNVQNHFSSQLETHNGRAIAILESTEKPGEIKIEASMEGGLTSSLVLKSR